jgi:hypothetical protein
MTPSTNFKSQATMISHAATSWDTNSRAAQVCLHRAPYPPHNMPRKTRTRQSKARRRCSKMPSNVLLYNPLTTAATMPRQGYLARTKAVQIYSIRFPQDQAYLRFSLKVWPGSLRLRTKSKTSKTASITSTVKTSRPIQTVVLTRLRTSMLATKCRQRRSSCTEPSVA